MMIGWSGSLESEPEQAVNKGRQKGLRAQASFDASGEVQGGWARHVVKANGVSPEGLVRGQD